LSRALLQSPVGPLWQKRERENEIVAVGALPSVVVINPRDWRLAATDPVLTMRYETHQTVFAMKIHSFIMPPQRILALVYACVLSGVLGVAEYSGLSLSRSRGQPLSIVLGSEPAGSVNLSVDIVRSHDSELPLTFSWLWNGAAGLAVSTLYPLLSFSPAGAGAGAIMCVAHSKSGTSAPITVVYLTTTDPPVILVPPAPAMTVSSGNRLVLTGSASGTGNVFSWYRLTQSLPAKLLLRETSLLVGFRAVRSLPSLHSSTLVIPRVSTADAGGIDLVVWNPAGSAYVIAPTILVILVPPWMLRCFSPVVLFTTDASLLLSPGAAANSLLMAVHTGPWIAAIVTTSLIVDSAICGFTGSIVSAPECTAPVSVSWRASLVPSENDGNSEAVSCAWTWAASDNSSEFASLIRGSFDAHFGGDEWQTPVVLRLIASSTGSAVQCILVVDFSATPGPPFSVDSAKICTIRSALPTAGIRALLQVNRSHFSRGPSPEPSATPFPGWVLLPSSSSLASSSPSQTPLASPIASPTPESSSASSSVSSSLSASPNVIYQPSSGNFDDDVTIYVSACSLAAGTLFAALVLFSVFYRHTASCVHLLQPKSYGSLALESCVLNAVVWLQFVVMLDQSMMPFHARQSSIGAALQWASGFIPFGEMLNRLPLLPSLIAEELPAVAHGSLPAGNAASVGLPRFAAHMVIVAAALPVLALVSTALWCVLVGLCLPTFAMVGRYSAARLLPRRPVATLHLASMKRTQRVWVAWPKVLRACFHGCSVALMVTMPSGLASSLWAVAHLDTGTPLSIVAAFLALVLWSLVGALLVFREYCPRRMRPIGSRPRHLSVISHLVLSQLASALAIGLWDAAHGTWIGQGITLCATSFTHGGFATTRLCLLRRRSQQLTTDRASSSSSSNISTEVLLLLQSTMQVTMVISLMCDANTATHSTSTLSVHNSGAIIAVVIQCFWGSVLFWLGVAVAISRRQEAIGRRCALHSCMENASPPTSCIDELGLNASFLGGRSTYDLSGALAFWALWSGLVVAPRRSPAPLHTCDGDDGSAGNLPLHRSPVFNPLVSNSCRVVALAPLPLQPWLNHRSYVLGSLDDEINRTSMAPVGVRRDSRAVEGRVRADVLHGEVNLSEGFVNDAAEGLVEVHHLGPAITSEGATSIESASRRSEIITRRQGIRIVHLRAGAFGASEGLVTGASLSPVSRSQRAAHVNCSHLGPIERIGFRPLPSRGFLSQSKPKETYEFHAGALTSALDAADTQRTRPLEVLPLATRAAITSQPQDEETRTPNCESQVCRPASARVSITCLDSQLANDSASGGNGTAMSNRGRNNGHRVHWEDDSSQASASGGTMPVMSPTLQHRDHEPEAANGTAIQNPLIWTRTLRRNSLADASSSLASSTTPTPLTGESAQAVQVSASASGRGLGTEPLQLETAVQVSKISAGVNGFGTGSVRRAPHYAFRRHLQVSDTDRLPVPPVPVALALSTASPSHCQRPLARAAILKVTTASGSATGSSGSLAGSTGIA
jgi:hypothetical protein